MAMATPPPKRAATRENGERLDMLWGLRRAVAYPLVIVPAGPAPHVIRRTGVS